MADIKEIKKQLAEWKQESGQHEYFLLHTYVEDGEVKGSGDWAVKRDTLKKLFCTAIANSFGFFALLQELTNEITDAIGKDDEKDNQIQDEGGMAGE